MTTQVCQRRRLRVNGIVQGVGFRPFVFRLAEQEGLAGSVINGSEGVVIEVEGDSVSLDRFERLLRDEAPPLALITDFESEPMAPRGEAVFTIQISRREKAAATLVSPDMSVCDDCLRELFDASDRRYRYPFINCTNCGPRFTITARLPYDRPFTSMAHFPMCPDCEREYRDPADRRFHAQPNACPRCGPHVWLTDAAGTLQAYGDPIRQAAQLIRRGRILAIRGLGGFHLVADAINDAAVWTLRSRKQRPEKPFALMAPNLAAVATCCHIGAAEEALLSGPTRPIVLLEARADHGLAAAVAPGMRHLGFMLPYTPLHHLLLAGGFRALIMTSGNASDEPIAIGNDEALERLSGLADYFLFHDRDILQRCDDSIARVVLGRDRILRRARGYVPRPVLLARPTRRHILACGGELKNTVALARDRTVFLSQHIGDLEHRDGLAFFEEAITYLRQVLEIEPQAIAHDQHPEYLSSKWALAQNGLPRVAVQHHHAHLVSVMAENGVTEPTIGLILDGTGYGSDGTIWGGEVLVGDALGFCRHAWLAPLPLAGGASAIRQPWRMALAALDAAFGVDGVHLPFQNHLDANQIGLVRRMIARRINAPLTSSCGRLFDAVAAMLDIRQEVSYEAQAAIELEAVALTAPGRLYESALAENSGQGPLIVLPLIREIAADIQRGEARATIAASFHRTLAALLVRAAQSARRRFGLDCVGLSGGVFQNATLLRLVHDGLTEEGFRALSHGQVPSNDGGLALGQVLIADAAFEGLSHSWPIPGGRIQP